MRKQNLKQTLKKRKLLPEKDGKTLLKGNAPFEKETHSPAASLLRPAEFGYHG